MPNTRFIDANILLRYFTNDDPQKANGAKQLFPVDVRVCVTEHLWTWKARVGSKWRRPWKEYWIDNRTGTITIPPSRHDWCEAHAWRPMPGPRQGAPHRRGVQGHR